MPVVILSKKRPGHHYSVDILVFANRLFLRIASFFEFFDHYLERLDPRVLLID